MKKLTIIITASIFALNINAQINYNNNIVTGNNTSALGKNNTVSGPASFVSGYNSEVTGSYSSSLGYNNTVSGHLATAIGSYSIASGKGSVAIGNKVDAISSYCYVIGRGIHSHHLINNISNSFMVGFESDRPTFFVGSSKGLGTFGKVGIGTTEPIATLDVNGDLNFSGTLLHNGQEFKNSLWTKKLNNIYYSKGNVGIGTKEPAAKLYIAGNNNGTRAVMIDDRELKFREEGVAHFSIFANRINNVLTIENTSSSGLPGIAGMVLIAFNRNGNVTINKNLWVKQDIWVQTQNPWGDFVFENDYKLTPLNKLEKFINKNKHLPGIPSAKEIKKKGLNIAETDAMQMIKIEELTLYIIEQNKRIEKLEKQIKELQK